MAPNSGDERASRLVVEATLRSHVGKVRTENQDFGLVERGSSLLLVVADGMGGHRGGATASKLAADIIRDSFTSDDDTDVSAVLRRALEAANDAVYREAEENPDLRGMGTTCSAMAVLDDRAYVAHVGDSRIYLIRDGEIRQVTEDHSLVASMVREGLLTSQEAEVHPRRNILQRSIGVAQDVEVDTPKMIALQAGDQFILCSDGLSGQVKDAEILELAAGSVDETADRLVERALERGAPDNVTVIVARVVPAGEADPEATVGSSEVQRRADDYAETADEPTANAALTIRVEAPHGTALLKWILVALLTVIGAGFAFLWTLSRFGT